MRTERTILRRAIYGALEDTIKSHGPITPELIPSATKRILGALAIPKEVEFSSRKAENCDGCRIAIKIGEKFIKTTTKKYHIDCIPLPNSIIDLRSMSREL